MTLNKAFRLSTYLSLAFSTACLGYTERLHLPNEALGFYPALIVLFFVAFVVEERWAMPKTTANLVAIGIIFAFGGWLALELRSGGTEELEFDVVRWALPRMGPLMGILLLAKLFRPKLPSDYWLLHMLGLIQIALACVLDRDLFFGFLLLCYVVVTLWSLMLFHLHRESAAFCTEPPPVKGQARQAPRASLSPWKLLGLRQMGGWALVGIFGGLLLFFLVPRPGQGGVGTLFIPAPGRSQTGFSPEINLQNQGVIEANDEVVMRVTAYAGGNEVALPADQRWRGITCSNYKEGRWSPSNDPLVPLEARLRQGPNDIELYCQINVSQVRHQTVRPGSRGVPIFLAEPIRFDGLYPVVYPDQARLSVRVLELAVFLDPRRTGNWPQYRQIALRPGSNVVRRRILRNDSSAPTAERVTALTSVPGSATRVKEKAIEILKAARAESAPNEVKARALERHLVASGEYQYTLDRRREDSLADPTVDFLCNVKQGHCELYASALALMLRSQNIPARVVIGFRGVERTDLGNAYLVRQNHAHAWVEAFIEQQRGSDGRVLEGYWLALDGVPLFDATAAGSGMTRGFWEEGVELARFVWEHFILDYNADTHREQLLVRLENLGVIPSAEWRSGRGLALGLAALCAVVGLIAGVLTVVRLLRRRRPGESPGARRPLVGFYARLVRILARVALRPKPAQTPRELGAQAGSFLSQSPATGPVAGVPAEVAEAFYDVRFGGRDLVPDQLASIEQKLDRLDQALEE